MWKKRNGFWSLVTAALLLLTFSTRARRGTRKAILKGADAAIDLTDQWRGKASKTTKRSERGKDDIEVARYPSYVGYEANRGLNDRKGAEKVRKVNPTRFKNAKNVMNDEVMPYHMAEIAEEFDLD